ncbi:hypothetical protein AM228_19760 [Planktothricoides sp. SR001]|nr:hypothetical protein AM228_19760 [Planktothricoides sp. SR001]
MIFLKQQFLIIANSFRLGLGVFIYLPDFFVKARFWGVGPPSVWGVGGREGVALRQAQGKRCSE